MFQSHICLISHHFENEFYAKTTITDKMRSLKILDFQILKTSWENKFNNFHASQNKTETWNVVGCFDAV